MAQKPESRGTSKGAKIPGSDRLPVTVLTGFLGSGKTTILNHLIRREDGARTLVIINEFGEIGLDHMLVTHSTEGRMIEMSSGCLCCTIRTDLVETLRNIPWRFSIRGERLFDRVVIETTGLADPAPVIQTLVAEPTIAEKYQLDGVVTVVDCVHGPQTIAQHDEALHQVVVADLCLLSKSDLVDEKQLARVAQTIESLNPAARRQAVVNGEVGWGDIVDLGIAQGRAEPDDIKRWLSAEQIEALAEEDAHHHEHEHEHGHDHDHAHEHHHDVNRHGDNIRADSFVLPGQVDPEVVTPWFEQLAGQIGDRLLRLKGILAARPVDNASTEGVPMVIHAVQHVMHTPVTLPAWPDDGLNPTESRVVLITRDVPHEEVSNLVNKLPTKLSG